MRIRSLWLAVGVTFAIPSLLHGQDPAYLTTNPFKGDTIPSYDSRVSPYSPYGARNQYTTNGGRIYGQDGTYLGKLNSNPYDPESVANPYGQYGSQYSQNSVNNPYGRFGSQYSQNSARNPYATNPPVVLYQRQNPQNRLKTYRYCNSYLEDCDQ